MWLEERPTKTPRWTILTEEEEEALYEGNRERQREFFRGQREGNKDKMTADKLAA